MFESIQLRARRSVGYAAIALGAFACAEIGTSPDEPAAIEMAALPAPAVVINDSLRNIDGVATPLHAVVRNIRGDVISDAHVTYIYADLARDTALAVDSATGFVKSLKAFAGGANSGRLAARAGDVLQVLRTIDITTRPDSMDRVDQTGIATLVPVLPDTGRAAATANTSAPLNVVVRHIESPTSVTVVRSWQVKYELVQPVNATNDTTKSVFLVDDQGHPSTIGVSDASGIAFRQVRIRASSFPDAGTTIDSVVVNAIVRYKGVNVKGSPYRIVVSVQRK